MASVTPQEASFIFPAMTICPNFNSAYNVTALRVRIRTITEYKTVVQRRTPTWISTVEEKVL